MLTALHLPPGLYRNGTRLQSKGRWWDANLVRWLNGTLQPIGGWARLFTTTDAANTVTDTFTEVGGSLVQLPAHVADTAQTWFGPANATCNIQVNNVTDKLQCYGAATTGPHVFKLAIGSAIDDPIVEADITRNGDYSTSRIGLLARGDSTSAGGDLVEGSVTYSGDANHVVAEIAQWTSGSRSVLATSGSIAWALAATKTMTLSLVGATVSLKLDGVQVLSHVLVTSFSDSSHRHAGLLVANQVDDTFDAFSVTGQPVTDAVVVDGVPRAIIAWQTSGGRPYFAVGSTETLSAYSQGVLTDITPSGFTTGNEDASTSVGGSTTYGGGFYGANAYGIAQPLSDQVLDPDVWQLDTFGEYLVGVMAPSDGVLYVWPLTGDAAAASGAPVDNRGVVVTPERFLVALGAGGDPRAVAWASQETTDDWTPSGSNTAGDFSLETNGQIVAGRRGNGETLIWTDQDLHRMTYIGGTLVYAFAKPGFNCGLIAPNAVARYDTSFAWMGLRSFYTYNGFVRDLPCEVADGVFSDFNFEQRAKVSCFPNVEFGEVWWFYPSAGAIENDRYVTWNWRENHWNLGQLARTCGMEMSASFRSPLLCAPDGTVYSHELGHDMGTETPYAESGPVEIADGDRILHATQLVPDENTLGDVSATLYSRFLPTETETTHGPYSLAAPTPIRLAGRQVQVKVTQERAVAWRVGTLRLDAVPGGRR